MSGLIPKMSGGKKQHWLRIHRGQILAYFKAHGELATREKYNMKQDTWNRFMNPSASQPNTNLTKSDKAILRAEISEQGLRDVRKEVKELKENYGKFTDTVSTQLSDKFFKPLLREKIELPPELEHKEKPDLLKITSINIKQRRQPKTRGMKITSRRPRIPR